MVFLQREEIAEKEKLTREYNLLREEILDRSYKTWVITIVLIVGSLLVALAPADIGFPLSVLSIVLIAVAIVLHATSERVSAIDYYRLHELEDILKIAGSKRLFELEIAGKWWYRLRRSVVYVIFVILVGIYLFMAFSNIWILSIVVVVGLIVILLKEATPYEKTKLKVKSA